jgi:hypothetical protein
MDIEIMTPADRRFARMFCWLFGSHRDPLRGNFAHQSRDGQGVHICLDCGTVIPARGELPKTLADA